MSDNERVWEKIVLPKIPPPVIDLSSDTDGDVPDLEDEVNISKEDDKDVSIEELNEDSSIDLCRENDYSNLSTSPIAISDEINSNFDEMSRTREIDDDEDSAVRVAEDIFGNSDDEFDIKYETIEVVQLHVNCESENAPSEPHEEEYVTFFDPLVDFENEGEGETCENHIESGASCGNSKTEVRDMSAHDSNDSPQPSTSKACQDRSNGRKPLKSKDKSLKSKRVRFQTNNSESDSSEKNNEPPVAGRKRKLTQRKKSLRSSKRHKVQTPPDSESDGSSSSLFEAITVFRKKAKPPPPRSRDTEKSPQSKPSKPRPSRIKRSSLQLQLDSDSDSEEKSNQESSDSGAEVDKDNKRRSKRFTRSKIGTQDESKMKKAAAFEKLREKRERMANKPKRLSPIRSVKTENENEDSVDDESSYTSGSSPCPIVDNSSAESSNFDSSTPSSSSVTSDAETEEEVDLEIGGSEGEKDLPQETPSQDNSSDSDGPVKSCSSTSEDEAPDDGQNDDRCILCKNLGSKLNLLGRARNTVTEQTFDW